MKPDLPRKKAPAGHVWRRLLCLLRPRRQKKVAHSTYVRKLLNQTSSMGASCVAVAAFSWLGSPQLLEAMALEAARLSRCSRRSHLGQREVLLAMELVLLRELSKPPQGPSSCKPALAGPV